MSKYRLHIQTSFPGVQGCRYFNPVRNGGAKIARAQVDPDEDTNQINEK